MNNSEINQISGWTHVNIGKGFICSEKDYLTKIVMFIIKDNELVAFLTSFIDDTNNVAKLAINHTYIEHIKSLSEINPKIKNKDSFNFSAICTNISEYNKQGLGRELILRLMGRLINKGIDKIEVMGITSEEAMNFYIATGATKINSKCAEYNGLEELYAFNKEKSWNNGFEY